MLVGAHNARSGLGRSGAFHSGAIVPNLVVEIQGVDRSSVIMMADARVSLARNNQASTAHLSIKPSAAIVPTVGQSVVIGLGSSSNRLMAGQVSYVTHNRRKLPASPWMESIISVDVWDWLTLFNRRLVNKVYREFGATLDAIVRDVMDLFTSGFSYDSVQASAVVPSLFTIEDETPGQVLTRLVQLNGGGGWYIDPSRDVHWFGPSGETSPHMHSAPQTIAASQGQLLSFASGNEGRQIRNRVIVKGRSTRTLVTVPNDYDGVVAWGVPLEEVTMFHPTGGMVNLGGQIFDHGARIQAPDVGDDIPTVATTDAVANVGDTSISVVTSAAFTGVLGSAVWVTDPTGNLFACIPNFITDPTALPSIPASGYGSIKIEIPSGSLLTLVNSLKPIAPHDGAVVFEEIPQGETARVRVMVEDTTGQTNLAAIEGGDGIHEHLIDDSDATYLDAEEIGQADLDAFADATGILQGDWTTEDMNAFPGGRQVINISGTTDDLSATRTIETVEITFPVTNYLPHRRCTAADVKLAELMVLAGPVVE